MSEELSMRKRGLMTASTRTQKTDKRVLRTRKAIMSAYDKLLSDKRVNKITVSAIAREANIDRKTFYLHFKSVGDLAAHRTEEMLERILGVLVSEGTDKSFIERTHIILTEVNNILSENIEVYSNIATHASTDQALLRLEQAAGPAIMNTGVDPEIATNPQLHLKLQFYIAGAISLYFSWLKSDHSQPIETVSNAIEDAILTLRDA